MKKILFIAIAFTALCYRTFIVGHTDKNVQGNRSIHQQHIYQSEKPVQ